uniref:Ras-GAP domain-containing protein n=1 Tax=Arcella intermedia TaxID=1963864 RepID=A0A6B2KWZ6_9EUKA
MIKLFFSQTKPTAHNEICACFINLAYSNESVFPLFNYIIKDEFETSTRAQVLRENSLASKIIKPYLETIGRDYLIDVLSKHIQTVSGERKVNFEIDPSKITEKDEVDKNLKALEAKSYDILRSILDSAQNLPIGIRMIARIVKEQSQIHHPDQVNIFIGSFLFLRFIGPALFSPENTEGLLAKGKLPSNTGRRNLILVTKLLQNLSNEKLFDKEVFMKPLNSFITNNRAELAEFYKKVVDFRYNPGSVHDVNTISDDTLQYFHSLLSQADDIVQQFKNKNHANEFTDLLEKLGSYKHKISITELDEFDQKTARSIVESRNEELSFTSNIEIYLEKKKQKTKLVLLIGSNKIFVWKPKEGKILREYHLVELSEIYSDKPTEVSLVFNAERPEGTIILFSTPEKIDEIIHLVRRTFVFTFHRESFKLKVKPDTRIKEINRNLGVDSPCHGLSRTYQSLCVYYDVPLNPNILNSIENYYSSTTLNLDRFTTLSDPPISDKEIQPLFHAIGYNTYFTSLIVKHMKFDKNTIEAVYRMLAINNTIEEIAFEDVSIRDRTGGFGFFESMASNKEIAVSALSLAGTVLESNLATYLSKVNRRFMKLDLSQPSRSRGEKEEKKEKPKDEPFRKILPALTNNPTFTENLVILNLAGNKMDSEVASSLADFLRKTCALEVLNLSSTKINLSVVLEGLINSKSTQSLVNLDVSNQRILRKGDWENMLTFLQNYNLCSLQYLDISNTQIPIECLVPLLTFRNENAHSENRLSLRAAKNNFDKEAGVLIGGAAHCINSIISLDLSDNNLGDEGVLALCEGLYHNNCLNQLNINRNFRSTEKRAKMIHALTEMVNSTNLKLASLSIAGANKGTNKDSRLKESIIPLLTSIAHNTTLTELDISGHAFGIQGAITLARVLEVNRTLMKINWDDNNVGLIGFQNISKGLKENGTVVDMPLPMSDVMRFLSPHNALGVAGAGNNEKEQKKEVLGVVQKIEKRLRANQQY